MLIMIPPLRQRPSRAKSHRLTGLGPVPPPAPVVTVTTDAPSYVIDPAAGTNLALTIADTLPSVATYLLQVSYDAPGSGGGDSGGWQTVATFVPLGDSYYNAADLPYVTPSEHCRFRATNNVTGAVGLSNEFALTPPE